MMTTEWKTLEELYQTERASCPHLFGTLLAWMVAIYRFLLLEMVKWFRIPFGKLKGSQALLLYSPFVLLYWLCLCVVMIVYNLALWDIIAVAAIWAILYEFPMDILNAHDDIKGY
jgi:hypothetical protein